MSVSSFPPSPVIWEGKGLRVVSVFQDISELDHLLRSQLQETQALAKGYISKLSELEMKGVDSSNTIFRSKEIQRVVEIAIRVAKVDSTVLLLGESGVGKGGIAKLIHKNSERSSGPFIRVDCGGIPETLKSTRPPFQEKLRNIPSREIM